MKELAAKLKIADALLKKIVKDFDIPTAKVKSRVHLEDSSVQTVREIMALRASGKKTKEIKELFDASKETTKPEVKENSSQPEKKEAVDSSNPHLAKKKKIIVEKQEDIVAEVNENTEEVKKTHDTRTPEEIEEARARAKAKSNKRKAKIKKAKAARELNAKNRENNHADANDTENSHRTGMMNLNEYLDTNETENDFKANLDINEDDSDLDEDLSIDGIDDDEDDDDEDDDPKSDSKTKNTNKKTKIRRRQFSYKYIQRQIMNDQKRVQYIQQRLQRGRLSTKEKMELEESLEIRDKLLAGWVKLLRWVKS